MWAITSQTIIPRPRLERLCSSRYPNLRRPLAVDR